MPTSPHGGRLIEGTYPDEGKRIELLAQAEEWPYVVLDPTAVVKLRPEVGLCPALPRVA